MPEMYEINAIHHEIYELKDQIERWHVDAWRQRVAGNRPEMKLTHKKINICKKKIKDFEWLMMQCRETNPSGYTLFNMLTCWAVLRLVEFLFFLPHWLFCAM